MNLKFNHGESTVPGTLIMEVCAAQWSVPVAVVYWRWSYDHQIEILYINVVEQLRRKGIATRAILELRNCYPHTGIVTMGGTKLGKEWMRRTGWQKDEQRNCWFITAA